MAGYGLVVKVGGSLYDLPDLGWRLAYWLSTCSHTRILLVPGGGVTADAIRTLDRTHHLGEETSHWLAIQALSINARFLQALLPGAQVVNEPAEVPVGLFILDAWPFFQADEQQSDHFPHRWDVTSDSLALRVAQRIGAAELVLLKSASDDWRALVDDYFAGTALRTPGLRIRVVNLRGDRAEGPRGR